MNKNKIWCLIAVMGLMVFSSSIVFADKSVNKTIPVNMKIEPVTASNEPSLTNTEVIMEKIAERKTEKELETEWNLKREDYDNLGVNSEDIPYATDDEKEEDAIYEGRHHELTDYEVWLCEQVVWVETRGSYWGSYYEMATILNRLDTGWADSIEGVCYQAGQYPACQFGWLNNEIDPVTRQAVRDCIESNTTPINLVYADSRHNYNGTPSMDYYVSFDGQDFYTSK